MLDFRRSLESAFPLREVFSGVNVGSCPEQRLVIEPINCQSRVLLVYVHVRSYLLVYVCFCVTLSGKDLGTALGKVVVGSVVQL